jgi:hypothetical protein
MQKTVQQNLHQEDPQNKMRAEKEQSINCLRRLYSFEEDFKACLAQNKKIHLMFLKEPVFTPFRKISYPKQILG